MKKTNLLQKLQQAFSDSEDKTLEGFKAFDEGANKLKQELKQRIQASTLEDVNNQINKLRKSIDLDPIIEAVDKLKEDFTTEIESLVDQLNDKSQAMLDRIEENNDTTSQKSYNLTIDIGNIQDKIQSVIAEKNKDLQTLGGKLTNEISGAIKLSENKVTKDFDSKLIKVEGKIVENKKETDASIKELADEIPKLRTTLMSRMSERGGGNMNRQIVIGGNPSTLGKYTDINFKAGSNVTISYANNETTKRVDVTISSSGGGSVGGTVRQIQTLSVSSTIATVTGTDQVYLCSAGIQVTLPTAVSDTNLYTIKNVSNSSILISGTIDDDVAGIIMPIKYTSVDIISNNTDWNIT